MSCQSIQPFDWISNIRKQVQSNCQSIWPEQGLWRKESCPDSQDELINKLYIWPHSASGTDRLQRFRTVEHGLFCRPWVRALYCKTTRPVPIQHVSIKTYTYFETFQSVLFEFIALSVYVSMCASMVGGSALRFCSAKRFALYKSCPLLLLFIYLVYSWSTVAMQAVKSFTCRAQGWRCSEACLLAPTWSSL